MDHQVTPHRLKAPGLGTSRNHEVGLQSRFRRIRFGGPPMEAPHHPAPQIVHVGLGLVVRGNHQGGGIGIAGLDEFDRGVHGPHHRPADLLDVAHEFIGTNP